MDPDLEKLRRFSLMVGLLLITYAFAVDFDPSKTISPLGLSMKVTRPELLPIGLVLASLYSSLRFAYYGYVAGMSPSPPRRRRWRDLSLFNAVSRDPEIHTLVWPNGADFDPATLHDWPEHEAEMAALEKRWGSSASSSERTS